MSEYTLSTFAQRDLVAAAIYVAESAGNPEIGDRLLDHLLEVVQKLADFPTMGRSRIEIRPRLRSFPTNPYTIFYRQTKNGIHVVRILHQRQDIEEAFPTRPTR